jgi:hypothetical protein
VRDHLPTTSQKHKQHMYRLTSATIIILIFLFEYCHSITTGGKHDLSSYRKRYLAVDPFACITKVCPAPQGCFKRASGLEQCYDSSKYQVVTDDNDSSNKCLCANNNGCFKGVCYSKVTHHVVVDQFNAKKVLCGINGESCNYACFDPNMYSCDPITGKLRLSRGCCSQAGAPGWGNQIRPGGSALFTSDTTPKACCLSCIANAQCAQWAMVAGVCNLNVNVVCVGPVTNFDNSGMLRCPSSVCASAIPPTTARFSSPDGFGKP